MLIINIAKIKSPLKKPLKQYYKQYYKLFKSICTPQINVLKGKY